jgi:hypothetical protein
MKATNNIIPIKSTEILASTQGPLILLWTIRKYGPMPINKLFSLIFAGDGDNWSKVARSTASRSVSISNMARLVVNALNQLVDAGLVSLSGNLDALKEATGGASSMALITRDDINIEVSPRLLPIQHIFDISITDYAQGQGSKMRIEPSFGKPIPEGTADIFVVMPFADDLKPIYDEHILPTVQSLNLTCKRGDDFFTDNSIMQDIWSAIYYSKLCIAECTGRNANVFYEMGIAHTLGRSCIMIAQSNQDIPFDVQYRRVLFYENTPSGLVELRSALSKAIQSELGVLESKQNDQTQPMRSDE